MTAVADASDRPVHARDRLDREPARFLLRVRLGVDRVLVRDAQQQREDDEVGDE